MRVKITIDTTSDLCVTYDVRPDTYASGDEPACGGTIWYEDWPTEPKEDVADLARQVAEQSAFTLYGPWTEVEIERITK